MEMPDGKSIPTRRMLQNVREAGFIEKRDLRENLIGHAPFCVFQIGRTENPTREGALYNFRLTIFYVF